MCSLHFPGGKKSFGALPTVVKVSCRQTVNSSQGKIHGINTSAGTFQSEKQTTSIYAQESPIDAQESHIEKLKTEHAVLQRKYDELSFKYKQCVLQIEHVLANDTTFKFYTGFQDYVTLF